MNYFKISIFLENTFLVENRKDCRNLRVVKPKSSISVWSLRKRKKKSEFSVFFLYSFRLLAWL